MNERPPPDEAARAAIETARKEIEAVEGGLSAHLFSAFLSWFMRWSVWFAVIWGITAYTGDYEWLWPLGFALAAVSLVISLGTRLYAHRSAARKRESLDALEARMNGEGHDAD